MNKLGTVSVSDLAAIDVRQSAPIQPQWIEDEHPHLTEPMHHQLSSVEEFEHEGNHVRITTTHEIEVNGQVVMPHASITQLGHVTCHSTPYAPYESVADLVRSLITNTPEDCIPQDGGDHEGHDHHRQAEDS